MNQHFILEPSILDGLDQDGFCVVPDLVGNQTVKELRQYYDMFLNRQISCGIDDRELGGITRQVMFPSKYCDYFRSNEALEKARDIAKQVFQRDEIELHFDMLISKQPQNENPTPWHQDFAYSQHPFVAAGTPILNKTLQFWVPLDDVDPSNGCMHFIPGVHKGLSLKHYVARDNPANPDARLLATDEIDLCRVVACPLKSGSCTIHFEGTPHFTTGNITKDRQRRAYIFNLRAAGERAGHGK